MQTSLLDFIAANQAAISVLVALLSALTSLGLLLLYFRQNLIQSKQTKIMASQTEIMEAEHEPHVELDQVGTVGYGSGGPQLIFYLTNTGKGTATNLRVTCEATPIKGQEDISFQTFERFLSRTGPGDQNEHEERQLIDIGNYIRPGEGKVPFYFPAFVEYKAQEGRFGRVSPAELPMMLAISDDDNPLRKQDPDDEQTDTRYKIEFNESSPIWTSLSDASRDFLHSHEEISVEPRERVQRIKKGQEASDLVQELIDLDAIRLKYRLRYDDLEEKTREKELLDYVIPLSAKATNPDLFAAGEEYSEYESSHEYRLLMNLARQMDEEK